MKLRSSPLWLLSLPLWLTALGALGACDGATCGPGTQEKNGICVVAKTQADQATAIQLTYLKLDHDPTQPLYVHNALHATVGLTSQGARRITNVSLGLMKRRPGTDPILPADFAAHPGCFLGGGDAVLSGDGGEQRFQYSFTIPHECLRADSEVTVNPVVFFDAEGRSGESSNVILLTPQNQARPENQPCQTQDERGALVKGCSVDLRLRPSPGVDVALTAVTPQSSIAVLYPQTPPKDLMAGKREDLIPILTVEQHATAYGRDPDDTDSDLLPDVLWVTYSMQAPASADARWMPLYFTGGSSYLERPRLRAAADNREQIDLYAQQEVYDLIAGGAWASQEEFLLRGCVQTFFTERGDPLVAGADGAANNCRTQRIKLVKAQPRGQSASEYSLNTDWSRTSGSSGSISLNTSFYSHNLLNTSGASSDTQGYCGISTDSFIGGLDLVKLWGRAAVPIEIVGSYIDVGVQVVGTSLFSYYRTIPKVDYSKDDISFSKQYCKSFTYYALPLISPTIELCATGTVALPVALSIDGEDQPDKTPPRLGVVNAVVTPTANFSASAKATVSLLVVRGGVEGTLTLLQATLPTTGRVTWGLNSLSPLQLQVGGEVSCDLRLNTLSGSISAFIDTWSFWDGWGRSGTYSIASWSGLSSTYSLLHRSGTSTIGK